MPTRKSIWGTLWLNCSRSRELTTLLLCDAVLFFQAHVFDILRAKFTDYRNFHTMLYTCAKEFDFLGTEMPMKTAATMLLPTAMTVSLIVVWKLFNRFLERMSSDEIDCDREGDDGDGVDPAVAYNVVQMFIYGAMAVMIMRLKLFWSPHLCVVAGLLASFKVSNERKLLELYCWRYVSNCNRGISHSLTHQQRPATSKVCYSAFTRKSKVASASLKGRHFLHQYLPMVCECVWEGKWRVNGSFSTLALCSLYRDKGEKCTFIFRAWNELVRWWESKRERRFQYDVYS